MRGGSVLTNGKGHDELSFKHIQVSCQKLTPA